MGKSSCIAEKTMRGLNNYPWLHTGIQKGVEMWTLTVPSVLVCCWPGSCWGFTLFLIDSGIVGLQDRWQGRQSLRACPASVLLNTPALEIWTFCLMLHLEVLASVGKWEKYSTAQSDFYSCGYKKPCVAIESLVVAKWFWKYWSCSSYTFLFNLHFSFFLCLS